MIISVGILHVPHFPGVLSIDFTENDYNQVDESNYIRTRVSKLGIHTTDLNIQITPLTFSQAANRPESPCNGMSQGSENPAEGMISQASFPGASEAPD